MYMAGVPSHVIQCGNNRDVCFFAEQDYLFIWIVFRVPVSDTILVSIPMC
jgi:hypothetical protein